MIAGAPRERRVRELADLGIRRAREMSNERFSIITMITWRIPLSLGRGKARGGSSLGSITSRHAASASAPADAERNVRRVMAGMPPSLQRPFRYGSAWISTCVSARL